MVEDVGLRAEQRRLETVERVTGKKETWIQEYVEEHPETRGVYDIGEGYIAIITERGTEVMPRAIYEAQTPEQLLALGAISPEKYRAYQVSKERAFLEWERTVYPKWAEEYALWEEAKARRETTSGLITDINALIESYNVLAKEVYGEVRYPFGKEEYVPGLAYKAAMLKYDIETLKYYQPSWKEVLPSEKLTVGIEEFLKPIKESPLTAPMWKSAEASGFAHFLFAPVGFVKGVETTGLFLGTFIGDPWAAKVPRAPMPTPAAMGVFLPEYAPELKRYQKMAEKYPGIVIGDIAFLWLESKAFGWVAGKAWRGVKGVGAKVIPESVKKGWRYRVALPTKLWYETKVRAPLDIAIGKSRVYQHLYLTPKTTLSKLKYRVAALRWHLPSRVQKLFWPKEYALRGIEEAFRWETTKRGTVALLEQQYALPFYTQQTLWYMMPTKEWARIHYQQALGKRAFLDSQLGWAKGLYPAYGILPEKATTMLGLAEKMAQAERVPVKTPEMTLRLKMVDEQLKRELVTTGFIPTGRETIWSYRAALEFEQSTKYLVPTRYFTPKPSEGGEWVLSTWKGIGRWPKGKTMFDGALAMLEREVLVAPFMTFWGLPTKRAPSYRYSKRTFYGVPSEVSKRGPDWGAPAFGPIGLVGLEQLHRPRLKPKPFIPFELERIMLTPLPYLKPRKREKEILVPTLKPIAKPRKREKLKEKLIPISIPILTPAQTQKQFQAQAPMQAQAVLQKQLQIQTSKLDIPQLPWPPSPMPAPTPAPWPTPTPSPTPTPWLIPFPLLYPRRMPGAFGGPGGRPLRGKWFKREHPILTPEEISRKFFGFKKAKRKRSRSTRRGRAKTHKKR